MKLSVFALFVSALVVSAAVYEEEQYEFLFTKWVQQHKKAYDADEFFYRFNVFKSNLDKIHQHNQHGGKSWKMSMNQFGDMTSDEFIATHTGYNRINMGVLRGKNVPKTVKGPMAVPEAVDWRTEGAVTPVKDQGQCGSCWAFSTTGSTEGAYYLAKHQLISLSEQELVDCSQAEGNSGCEGGLMDFGFQYIIDNKGITTEKAYPYTAQDGTCLSTGKPPGATISSFSDVAPSDNDALRAAVAQQPVSIAIEADQDGFQFYSGGVFSADCGSALDHGVLVVGYNQTSVPAYWIVKNSWGGSWGDMGYIFLVDDPTLNGGTGQCGMLSEPSYPII